MGRAHAPPSACIADDPGVRVADDPSHFTPFSIPGSCLIKVKGGVPQMISDLVNPSPGWRR